MGHLTIIGDGIREEFPADAIVTVGRDPASTVVVADPSVSRCHLTIRCHDGAWTVRNDSSTGTFCDDAPIELLELADAITLHLGSRDGPALVLQPEGRGPDGREPPGQEVPGDTLTVISFGHREVFGPGQPVTVGRDPACTVVVADPSVSRTHLTVQFEKGSWNAKDHSSTGSFVGGDKVSSLVLDGPTTVHLGAPDGPPVQLAARSRRATPVRPKQPTPDGAATPGPEVGPAGPDLRIVCNASEHVYSPDRIVTIGRNPASTIVIDDPSVSHAHLALTCEQGRWIATDRSSTGTYQGRRQVESLTIDGPTTLNLGGRSGPSVQLAPAGPADLLMPIGGVSPHAATATVGAEFRSFLGSDAPAARVLPPLSLVLPVKAWWRSTYWRTGLPIFLVLVWLVPTILFYVYENASSISSPMAWAWSAYFGFVWAVLFWALVRPGKIPPIMLVEIVIFELLAGLPVAIQLETSLRANPSNLLSSIFTVGLPEESAKALAIVVVALIIHRKTKLSTRSYMYLGVLSGVTFGVAEAHEYILQYYQQFAQARLEVSFSLLLDRIVTDGINHALWAGICGFFIGLAVYHRRWLLPLLVLAIGIPAVLHGFGDFFASHWGWGQVIVIGISAILFVGYSSSGDQIDRVLGRLEQRPEERLAAAQRNPGV